MSVNSSSYSNASIPPSSLNMFSFTHNCLSSTADAYRVIAFTITSILVLLPLCILVIYLGLQRWRQQRSSTTISHSDLFTYHIVTAEMMSILGSSLICCGLHINLKQMMMMGLYLSSMNLSGQMLFHLLTCVERYLAVVHPITYLSLRKVKWVRIRNITTGCVWLLSFAWACLMTAADHVVFTIISFCCQALTIIVVSFCSLSVLCVLIRPGPGERGGGRQQVDQSKLRAFYTIMAILGVLLVRCGGSMLVIALGASPLLGETEKCAVRFSMFWFCLPSSLVLPLLFLQRAGKLRCCKTNNESGEGSD